MPHLPRHRKANHARGLGVDCLKCLSNTLACQSLSRTAELFWIRYIWAYEWSRVDFVDYGPACNNSVVRAAPLNLRNFEYRLKSLGKVVVSYGLVLIRDGLVRKFLPHAPFDAPIVIYSYVVHR